MNKKSIAFAGGLFIGTFSAYYFKIDFIIFSLLALALVFSIYKFKINETTYFILALFIGGFLMNQSINSFQLRKLDNSYISGNFTILSQYKLDEEKIVYIGESALINGKTYKEKALIEVRGERLEIGDIIRLEGRLTGLNPAQNPGLFDYKAYMNSKGIDTKIRVSKLGRISRSESLFLSIKKDFRSFVENDFPKGFSDRTSKLFKSLILSQKYMDKEDLDMIRDLGLSHLLAISGLHMGIIFTLITSFCLFLGLNKDTALSLSLLFSLAYISLIDFPVSAMRSFLMIFLSVMAFKSLKGYNPKKALAFSVILILFLDPLKCLDLGFHLSVLAVLAMVFFMPRFSVLDTDGLMILSSFKMAFVINLIMFPVLIYYFNTFNLLLFIANLLIVPVFSFMLGLSVFKLIFAKFSIISLGIASLLNLATDLVFGLMDLLSSLDFLTIKLVSPKAELFFIYYGLLFLWIKRRDISNLLGKRLFKIYSLFIVLIIARFISYSILRPCQISFLSIGNADACLIELGGEKILIDTGGDKDGWSYDFILKPYLEKNIFGKIDKVFISHSDLDHSGNLEKLVGDKRVGKIYTNSKELGNKYKVQKLKTGEKVKLGSAYFEVVEDGSWTEDSNDSSLVLRANVYGLNILFTGDLSSLGEDRILGSNIKADVLKLGHHGSETSSSTSFLKKVDPQYAIISVGKDNSYGHPSKEVLKRLEKQKIKSFRTDEDGMVQLVVNRFFYYFVKNPGQRGNELDLAIAVLLYLATIYIYSSIIKMILEEEVYELY